MAKAKITNKHNISLPMAVWLAHDEYQHDSRTNVISVTSLMKSTRQVILTARAHGSGVLMEEDVSEKLASRIGTAVHNSIEYSWRDNYKQAMKDLGYPKRIIDRIRIDPTDEELAADDSIIPIYFEVRTEKEINGWIVTGQFDICIEGEVNDVKSTSVFAYISGSSDQKYIDQLSTYKWLNPTKIVDDLGRIQWVFKDWSKMKALNDPNYPNLPVMDKAFKLKTNAETENWVKWKLNQIDIHVETPEPELPLCTKEEMWQKDSIWKVYPNTEFKRAMPGGSNFASLADAQKFCAEKGKGVIKEVVGERTGCTFCNVANICTQYETYLKQKG